MAKSGKPTPKSQVPGKKILTPASPKPSAPAKDWLERPVVEESDVPKLKMAFWGIAIAGLLWMLALSFGSGINADDKFQCDYSDKLVSYYSTFGKDTSALFIPEGNMHLYGGFFEIVTGFANKALGFQEGDPVPI